VLPRLQRMVNRHGRSYGRRRRGPNQSLAARTLSTRRGRPRCGGARSLS
jgi:hypothetical protein